MRRAVCAKGSIFRCGSISVDSNFNARVARERRQWGNLAALPRNVLATYAMRPGRHPWRNGAIFTEKAQ